MAVTAQLLPLDRPGQFSLIWNIVRCKV